LAGNVDVLDRNAAVAKAQHEIADQLLYVVLQRIIFAASQVLIDLADEPDWQPIVTHYFLPHSQILDDR
jgi:hypothetical protein